MDKGMDRGRGQGPAGAWQAGLSLLLGAACLAVWLREPQPFFMPNNDYFSFQRLAEDFSALRMPEAFKRMPVLPFLMALLHPLFDGPHPYLHAAIAVNIGFSLLLLYLVYRIAARLVPRAPALVALLLAGASQFQVMARQPLVEPALGALIAAALWLRLSRRPSAWIALCLAALCRIEALVLAPIFLAERWLPEVGRTAGAAAASAATPPPLRRELGLATLAALPALAWTLIGLRSGDGSGGYLELMAAMDFQPNWGFPTLALEQALGGWWDGPAPLPWLLLPFGVLTLILGLRQLWRRSAREAWLLVAGYLVLTAVVTAFGIAKTRYAYAGQWIPFVVLAQGLVVLADRLRVALPGRRQVARLLTGALALALVGPIVAGSYRRLQDEQHWIRYYAYEAYLLGDWVRQHPEAQDGIVTLAASQVSFMVPQMPSAQVMTFEEITPGNTDPAVLAVGMRRRGLSHVAYTYRALPETDDQRYYWKEINGDLALLFAEGEPVPGFRHVARLPIDPELDKSDVQIYRLDPP